MLLEQKGIESPAELSMTQYCAAHLVSSRKREDDCCEEEGTGRHCGIEKGGRPAGTGWMLAFYSLFLLLLSFNIIQGALSLSALQEHKRTGKGRFINYNSLPDVMWNNVIPEDFQIRLAPEDIAKMQQTAGVYSKGRGKKANVEWKEDSAKKHSSASSAVVDATKMFMDDVYNQMEALSIGTPTTRRR
jgi:hypothetical protein